MGCSIRPSGGGYLPREHAGKRRLPRVTSPQEYAEDHWREANDSTDPIHAGDAELVPGRRAMKPRRLPGTMDTGTPPKLQRTYSW
jgi:hypothetical protein